MRVSPFFAALALAATAPLVVAGDPDQAIRQSLTALQSDLPIETIAESPLKGIYQVQLKGGRVLYASENGEFLLQGYLYQIKNGAVSNLTEQAEAAAIAKQINALPRDEMVVFAPRQPKTHITVFTDTDCGYCQKLHSEVPELNRLGVEVRYVAFPRQGLNSPTYQTMVNVWCAKDQQAAMTQAKSRKSVPAASCDNPIAKQYQLGQMIGVQGTPAIVLANGQMIPGYQPADQLAKAALQAN